MEQGLTWKPVADGHLLPDLPTTALGLPASGRASPC